VASSSLVEVQLDRFAAVRAVGQERFGHAEEGQKRTPSRKTS
jgi:hypothetical protein